MFSFCPEYAYGFKPSAAALPSLNSHQDNLPSPICLLPQTQKIKEKYYVGTYFKNCQIWEKHG